LQKRALETIEMHHSKHGLMSMQFAWRKWRNEASIKESEQTLKEAVREFEDSEKGKLKVAE